ncbi:class I SAM-dependent methyltransferase [Saccharibacillus sp. CPCC 101409]|uniref:class I SAM-dependent methyltransferase n=1 Tax=Saccharibacillus sp. CPCC 101409 TaxID=3058041 RepID=UPI0026733DCE|nr:class I SAM-dependent methyltransferase [Saccharibacillus sp. CPCC 101409]MDO3409831.1 class I SAM-dependent methyltransferase [Saccharibacillus sp. CPCC 101409]
MSEQAGNDKADHNGPDGRETQSGRHEAGRPDDSNPDSKARFSDRVEAYAKYRPGYPAEAVDYVCEAAGLSAGSAAADLGAGTGIFSKLLLERGVKVVAVEPNREMREAAEAALAGFEGFRSEDASAEATGLPDGSVDGIVCAQAFHWFDREAARIEFDRILKPGGRAALIWNARLTQGSAFLEQYEELLLRRGTDYSEVNHRNVSPDILHGFFKPGTLSEKRFPNRQTFDFEGLSGRVRSSSYVPAPGTPGYEPLMEELREIFDRNQENGRVFFDYETEVYIGEV